MHTIRAKLEVNRLLRYCRGVPANGKILDVGCGDGFHLRLLRDFGEPGWTLEGVDLDERSVGAVRALGLQAHHGDVESLRLGANRYDLVFSIMTIEHVSHPDRFMRALHRILKPGGKLVLVTDSTETIDFKLFYSKYWGGYHFPRHFYLFNRLSLAQLASNSGFQVKRISRMVSPVNWVYSIHNYLVDHNAPRWLVNRFTLLSPVSLGAFTTLDIILRGLGSGALLNAHLRKPRGGQLLHE